MSRTLHNALTLSNGTGNKSQAHAYPISTMGPKIGWNDSEDEKPNKSDESLCRKPPTEV